MSNRGMLSCEVLGAHAPAFVSHTLGSSMSYQVLARKWRPATFDQMVGQTHVLHALTNALSQQRLHHAYLFTGTRGVGKTSLARLFAKGLNCEQGVTATPCGVCGSCVEIAQGRFVDLIEVDAASRTKVDDTRELLDNVQYRPTRGRFKVYLIDEVHMLSRSSFNALLKTLEEPPEHVKFLLATTDPQKLPVTVLSRCLQFNLKSLTQTEISNQLAHILTQEPFPYELGALTLLAKAANGSMRDALSLTDQAIAFGGGNVMLGQVQTMLGSIDEQHVVALLKALTDADIGVLMHTCAQVLAYGADAQEVLRSLLELLHQITLTQFAPAAAQQSLYSAQIRAFAEQLTPEQVQLYYQILLTGRKDLPHAPDPKSGLEMALLRAVAFVPEKPVKRWQPDAVAEISLPEGQTPIEVSATAQALDLHEKKFAEKESAEKKTVLTENTAASDQAATAQAAVVESATDAVGVELEFEDDAALVAEQAVILSQAQSQGFNADILDADIVNVDAVPQVLSTAQGSLTKHSTQDETSIYGNEAEHSYAPMGDYAQESAPLDSYQDAYVDFSSASYNDDVFNRGFDSQEAISSADIQPAPMAQVAAQIAAVSNLVLGQAQQQAAPVSLADDDILSAVLAARDSLLSDLDALSAKDGDEKKSSLDSKLKTPSTKPSGTTLPKTAMHSEAHQPKAAFTAEPKPDPGSDVGSGLDSSLDIDFDDDFDLGLESVAPQSHGLSVNVAAMPIPVEPQSAPLVTPASGLISAEPLNPASYDRPPWEAAPEIELSPQVDRANIAATRVESSDVDSGSSPTANVPSVDTNSAVVRHAPVVLDVESAPDTPAPSVSQRVSNSVVGQDSAAISTQAISGHPLDLHWYKLMANLDIGGRVRQLAVNSIYQEQGDILPLLLKPNQKHLAADVAIEQLEQALSAVLGNPRRVQVVIGVDPERETPLELRKRFHQELLQQAHQSLIHDDNVQWLIQRMGAELDADSLVYPPELLNLRSQQIQALPELTVAQT